jgi:hypothetical protein
MMMAQDIPSLLGYHGQELNAYDDLLGGKNEWRNSINLGLWNLLAVQFLIVRDSQAIPGYHLALGPTRTASSETVYLYEADTAPAYVRVVPAAARIPADRIVATLVDPRFPVESIVLLPDSSPVIPAPIEGSFIPPSPVTATLAEWAPGSMRVQLAGSAPRESYLVVSENWYLGWNATIDGQPAAVHRGDNTLITVVIPPGAREVILTFHDDTFVRGKWVTAASTLLVLGLVLVPAVGRRRTTGV